MTARTPAALAACFWLAIIGGLVISVSWFFDPAGVLSAVGDLLFLVSAASFFVLAFRATRREDIGFARAVARSARDALRFAWEFLP
ncbi:MAG TPA: hypothetical protein VGJ77_07445 [Gaiellaceae bacterium]|jgi:hypothetical protein